MRQHAKHRKWAVPGNIDLAAHSFLVRLRFGHDHEHNARKVSGHLVTVVPSRAIRPRHLARFMAPLPPTFAGFLAFGGMPSQRRTWRSYLVSQYLVDFNETKSTHRVLASCVALSHCAERVRTSAKVVRTSSFWPVIYSETPLYI